MTVYSCGQPAALDCVSDCELHRLRARVGELEGALVATCDELESWIEDELSGTRSYKQAKAVVNGYRAVASVGLEGRTQ